MLSNRRGPVPCLHVLLPGPHGDPEHANWALRGTRLALSKLAELTRRVGRTWQIWQAPSAFRYDAVGQQLPALIRETQALEPRGSAARVSAK